MDDTETKLVPGDKIELCPARKLRIASHLHNVAGHPTIMISQVGLGSDLCKKVILAKK